MTDYLVATTKSWNIKAYNIYSARLPGDWHLITDPTDLTPRRIDELSPKYVFFPHWSWMVPEEILKRVACVCFHMTDLPYGRGGSPLQNLIVRGHQETRVTALRMTKELDAGPVYLKRELSLSGSAQQIFERYAELIPEMIEEIVREEPEPIPQQGEPVYFQRRRPEQSCIPDNLDQQAMYDFIRMLDAESYPKAFLDFGSYRMTFSNATLEKGRLNAQVSFVSNQESNNDKS